MKIQIPGGPSLHGDFSPTALAAALKRTYSGTFDLGPEVSLNWAPRRTLLYSVVFHVELVVLLAFGIPWMQFGPSIPLQAAGVVPKNDSVLYLPSLEPAGSSGPGNSGKAGHAGGSPGSPAPASRKLGRQLIHRGPQTIVSNPANPDNYVQTIRRPDLVSAPRLKSPLQLPNLVLLARSAPSLAPQAVITAKSKVRSLPKPAGQSISAVPAPSLALGPAKLTLPAASASQVPKSPPTPNPPAETSAQPKPAPVLPAPPAAVGGGNDDRSMAVLNALNIATQAQVMLPAGELHGAFAVGPGEGGNTSLGDRGAVAEQRSGSGPGGPPGVVGGTGTGGGTGAAGTGTGKGTGTGHGTGAASGDGPGAGGPGTGTGAGNAGAGTGTGHGKGLGSGGSGAGSGGGVGAGSGPGKGPFTEITIQGGGARTGTQHGAAGSRSGGTSRSYSYGMTIVASASSGGGLKDFGVFHNEPVYTVYIGMSDSDAPARDWTLQYAVVKSHMPVDPPGDPAPLVVPPFAIKKKTPQFPAEAVAKNVGRMMVVSAIINAEGKLENIHTIQSPNPLLTAALTEVLGKWEFRPAEVNGAHVAVKVVLGIPIGTTQ